MNSSSTFNGAFIQRIVLTLIGIASALFLLIAADRMLGWYLRKNGYVQGMIPNLTEEYHTREYTITARTSSQGIRNPDVGPKKKGVVRVLVVGDSFTYGIGVNSEDTWIRQLETQLRSGGLDVELINAGVPGVGLATEISFCRAYADRFDADYVVIGMYGTDDLYQNMVEAYDAPGSPAWLYSLWPTFARLRKSTIVDGWHRGSPSGAKITISKMWKVYAHRLLIENPGLLHALDPDIKEDFLNGNLNPDIFLYALQEPKFLVTMLDPATLQRALSATDHLMKRLKRECAGNRPVLVVLFPPEEMVDIAYQQYRQATGYEVDRKLLTLNIEDPIAMLSKQNGMQFVSVFPNFRKDGCPGCYYPWDIHMTPLGNRRAADILYSYMTSSFLKSARK